ncbi:MAG TPA: hypothetical protein VFQ69_03275 [Rhizomicrobium sp.]|nr:hypothetical protein [Rhizomicrobium sp.]
MCECHPTRRGLLGLTLGAAGASLLPMPVQAKDVTALAITCIDYRLVDDTVRFFHTRQLFRDYDQVSWRERHWRASRPNSSPPTQPSGTMSASPNSCTISAS